MSKNDRLRKVNSENRNYKLYKAKKQWVTACATFMLAFGATAVINASADAKPALNEPEEVAASATKTPAQTGDNLQNNSTTTADKATLNSAPTSQKSADAVSTNDTAAAKTKVTADKESANSDNSVNQPVSADTDKSQQNSTTLTKHSNARQLAESKVAQVNITPIPQTSNDGALVVAGTNMANTNPANFLVNGAALEKAGAKITWNVVPPTPTQTGFASGTTYSGSVTVAYADGTKTNVDVSFLAEPQLQLAPDKFYYVSEVGQTIDTLNTPDANGNTIFNYDDSTTSILSNTGIYGPNINIKLVKPLDTSTIGIHWADVQVTDNNKWTNGENESFPMVGDPYIVKVPYIVKTLSLKSNIPTNVNGDPVINAQLSEIENGNPAFDPKYSTILGQYFYQDFALAWALGITTTVSDWVPTSQVGVTTNSFKLTLSNLPNAEAQNVQVDYVTAPTVDPIYIYNNGTHGPRIDMSKNITEINRLINSGYMDKQIKINVNDKIYSPTKLTATSALPDGAPQYGKLKGKMNISFAGSVNESGQPIIVTNSAFANNAATKDFADKVNHWLKVTNNTTSMTFDQPNYSVTWQQVPYKAIVLAPTVPVEDNAIIEDVTSGPVTFASDDGSLATLVKNPTSINGWPGMTKPNEILNNNTTWPEGTTFKWNGSDGSTTLILNKAGETKTGTITVTLPSGSSCDVPITVVSRAKVEVKSETVDYGTTLSAQDLVENVNSFPEGTTFQFVNNSEPDWQSPGSYTNVQITATYKENGSDGKETTITTDPGMGAVAINDARSINMLIGSTVPSADEVLNLPSTWPAHTATWTTPINSNVTNKGEITVHYTDSDLDQIIKVYVSVIPKQSAVNGQNFFTNGNLYNGQTGSIANGTTTSTVLTSNGTEEVSYSAYNKSGNPGQQTTFIQGTDSYQPNYIISGLQTNADGLVSGTQTATIRVTVPANTIGAQYDADGKYYYYELNANVNVAQKVTFEFVDQYNNNAVIGQTYSQEFIPGVQANLNFNMTIPTDPQGYGYELANGTSIPTQYTLPAFTQTPAVVQVPIHQKMHFNIRFHDEDSNTDLGTVDVSGSVAGNGGFDPNVESQLKFPEGVNKGDYYSVSTSGVPEGVTLAGSEWTPLTNPNAAWYIPNYKWEKTEAVEKALTGATMTINLKHKINTTQEQQTRTATVNYVKAKVNADGTYTQDSSAAQSAVLDVYYSRNQYQDQVTKNKTYSPWLWDTTRGQNGYHVESGKWTSLPTSWGAVVADVPTVAGYTAAVITDKSGKPANEFVYPTWNTAGVNGNTDPTQASQAYTKDATAYEAQPVHTVLYIPVQTQSRLVTAKFIIAGGEKDGQDFAPASQVQIFYNRTGSLNVNNNTITYGNWQWDNTAGNSTTPGFKVLSGSWTLPTAATQSWSVNAPGAGSDYVMANINSAGSYSTVTFGAPGYNSNTTFTNSTVNQWFMRNELTTYYVPKSLVNKTVTRTITITEPGEATRTFSTNTAVLNRQVKVNDDDTGVVFDGFTGSGWNTDTWPAQTVPTHDGYTMSATKTVNGVTTPLTLVNGQVPAETVTDTTQNTTINITWGAVATATLTGNGESTYNGQAITNGELNNGLKVTVTGPTASSGTYTLQNGDVEFSTDGTTWSTSMPINAGKYQVRLTSQGEEGIKNQFGNNSIVWTNDGQSTITSNATYTINKLASAATMTNTQTGNYEMTYNGAAPSAIDPAKFQFTAIVNGQSVVLDATGLTSADFDWADGAAPVNVGTYQVKLNAAGLAKLQNNNTNFKLTNAGNGTFTINQANASATLSGSGTRPYNGNAVSVDDLNVSNDNNNITLTLHYPKDGNSDYSTTVKLNAGDFTWNTPNGQAPVNASSQAYTITINPAAIQKIIEKAVGTGQNDVSNVKFANGAITGTANYTITPLNTDATLANVTEGNYTKVYDAQATNQIDPAKFQVTVMVDGKKVTLDTQSFTGNSYEWVDASGNALTENPKNVGTYYVKLTDAAFNALQAQNPNFTLANTGLGVYTITPAEATGTLNGSNSKVYDGQAISADQLNSNGEIKVSLNFPGVNGQTYTLKQGDYTISGNATDVDNYTITLTQTGITNVENYIKSLAGSGQNDQSNVQFANNAISGQASFEITPSANVVSVSGTQTETYNGSAINVGYNASGNNSVVVSIAKAGGNTTGALANLTNVTLNSGDFTIVDGPAVNANTYQVQLTAAGLAKVQQALGKNYSISLGDTTGKLVVNKAKASAEFSGDPEYTYTGTPVSSDDYLGQYSIKLNEPNNPTYKLVAGDIEFNVNGTWTTNVPVNVGQYQVRLSQQGWNNIKAINNANVEWSATASAGTGTYTINQAKVSTDLSGNNSMVYNGSAVTTSDLYADGSTINVAINGTGIANLPATFTLSDGDYTWSTEDGKAPVNAGNYTIKLTEAGINHIQDQINQAVGQGNVALTTTADKAGTASFEIKQAVASNVQLYGNEQSTYNGQAVVFDPTNSETAKNFGFHNVENLTLPTLSTSDFTWCDANGNVISTPTNAGTYYLKLNAAGEQAFAKANPNYTFEDKGKSTISGQITYVVNPAELVIEVAGSAWKVFNDKSATITQDQIDKGDIKLIWGNSDTEPTGLGKFNLTPDDLEVVDSQGNPALHANAGIGTDGQPIKGTPYMVRLTANGLEKIKQLTGASNYAISQSAKSGEYFIYEHKAELTLTGNQTTVYGTAMPFDPSAYKLDFTNWLNTDKPIPNLTWKDGKLLNNGKDTGLTWDAGDLYVDGYPDGGVPTNVGNYRVKISKQLTDKLRKLFPDYDFSGNIGKTTTTDSNGIFSEKDVVEPSHTPASYVITPAQTTVTINGAEHIKYGENATINYGDNNGYSISITAPVHNGSVDNDAEPIYTNVTLSDGDLEFVTQPGDVGHYQVKLSAQGLKKLQDLTGSSNYDWKQASNARASFYVDQMPVTIVVSGQSSVDYGSQEWLNVIGKNPAGYTLTITTENGTNLSYTAKDGDLVFNQTPGNVGTYQVELSAQGLTNIEKALGTNYAYPQAAVDVTTKGTLTVKQGAVTVTLNGSDGKTYDANETLPGNLDLSKYNVTYSAPVYSANGTVQTLTLTANDLQIVGNATNVGTYQVELSPAGQAKLEQLTGNNGANYKWTFTTKANYKITAATATAELSGSNEKTFDGSAVTTAEVNSNGQILVHFTYPGSNAQSTYTLQDGDYTWNTKDGKAPTVVGNYTISLNKKAILAHLQEVLNGQAGVGQDNKPNVTIAADNLSGQASFSITPKEISNVTISGSDQSKTYNGQAADLDISGLTIKANGTLADTPLVNPGISASDFDWYDADGNKLDTAPVNVGTYEAHLKARTLAELQKANPNYTFSSVSGVINYTITPAAATATIGGSGSRAYSGQSTSVADVVNNVTWGSTGLVSGQTLNTAGITADSYVWYIKDSDGNYHAMTGDPVNAGTYYLRLTDNAISQLQKDNPNYKFADNAISGEFTYTINAVAGQATLSGQASKAYDGQAVTPAEVDSTNGNIIVHFTFPGSTAQSIYTLQDGDYTWKDGQAPVNAGTYTLKLSDHGLAHLQAAIDKYAGNGNVILDASDLSGSAEFTIKQKALDVTLGDNTRGTDGKVYDGKPAVINTQDTNFGVFTANGLVNGEVLNTANLTNADYEWVDADGNAASAPTNAGTYYIALNKSGLAKLQSNNPNYAISESGRFKYVISSAQAKVAITGSQESTEAKIDGANFKVNVPSGITVPAGMAYQFASGTTPDQSGVYLISLTPDSLTALEKANSNYKLNLSSTAEFTLDATLKIVFEDTQDGNKQVGKTITETGVAGSTIDNLGLAVPENYELAPDQTLPMSYTFTKALNQSLYIKLVHEITKINPVDPTTNPDPTNENWFKENGLVKDITRTINYTGLSDDQLAEIPADQKTQTVEFTRTAKYDLVTGEIVADSEGPWTAVDGKDTFAGFTPFTFAGYTATPAQIKEMTVTGNDKNSQITVTYTADKQQVTIKFVDDDKDGSQVGPTITETGVTDQTINITNVKIPAHYELAAGQTLPTSYTFKADGNNDIVIHLVEKTVTVNPVDPTTNPDPANQDWFKDNDLSKTVNRAIVDNLSSGAKTTTQSATITRTATYNEVTRKLTNYGNWTTAAWDAYQVNTPAGYTAKIVQISDGQDQVVQSIPSVNVTASTQPVRISITYTANAQTGKISYVASDGQEVGQTTINGKTGEPVKVTPQVPAGWKIVPGQDIPTTVTATANGIPAVTVKVEHNTITVTPDTPEKDIPSGKVPGDPSKNYEKMENLTAKPTRTIVVTSPSGEKTTITQAVSFTRTATFDEVTGEISYSDWTSAQPAEWSAYTAPEVAGYTASQAVTAQPVTPTTKNETVNIFYAANTQTGKIIYRDSTGKEIGQTSLTAKTGETIKISPVVPTNWQIAPGQDIPTVVTATANGIPAVVITVEPQTETAQEHKTVMRTIIEHLPSGDKTVVQTVKLTGTGTKNLVNGKVTALKWTTGQFAAFTPETVPGYTTNMSIVPVENVTFESANSTVEITYSKIPTPTDSQQVIQYQDENGTIISTETIKGQAGTEVAFNPQIPTNWQAVNAVPSTIKIDGGTTVILIKPQVESVQEHKTVTRTIIEHLPSGDKKVVQTVELTGDGTKNLVTGEISNLKWNSGRFAALTPEAVAGYTASPAVIAVEPVTVDTNNQTVDVAYTANEQTGKIIYRDSTGKEIGQTILTGRTGETIAVTPDLPAGWQPVTGQDVPATAVVTANGISTINITVEHKMIVIIPGQEAPTGQVPGNPDTTYEHMDALTDEITRTIKVENPDGQQQIVTQTVEFTRTAIFDEVTGQVTYSAWQPTGDTSWPAYEVPSVVGYTADRQDIPAETVAPGMSDQSITITYTKDAQPDQPVEPTTPTQPEEPNQPNKPVTPPHKPSMPAQPAVPTPGENLVSGNNHEKAVVPDQVVNDHIANRHSISTQLQQSSQMNKQQVKKLPQTGNATNKAAVTLGFAFATLASIFGLAGMRRKRRTK